MSSPDCPHQFSQSKPLNYCRNARQNLDLCRDLVVADKLGYIFRCRRVRCSRECNRAAMTKHGACVDKLLRDHLPSGDEGMVVRSVSVYRGHLRMPPGATQDDHKRAKLAFCRIMRRWARRGGRPKLTCSDADYLFECHAVQHITSPTECHWDVVAYSDAPQKALRAAVSAAWSRAGGLRQSLVPMDPDEIGDACKYQAKDVKPEIRRGTHFLPCKGMQFHWSTAGFWRGHKINDLWRECIAEWLKTGALSNTRDTLLQPSTTVDMAPEVVPDREPESPVVAAVRAANPGFGVGCKSVSLVLDDAAKRELLAEIDRRLAALPRRNAEQVFCQLPTDPDDATRPEWIADDAGLPVDHVAHLLRTKLRQRGAAELPRGQVNGRDWWYNERGVVV